MKKQKLISLFVAFAMLMSFFPVTSYAGLISPYDTTGDKGKIKMVLMLPDSNAASGAVQYKEVSASDLDSAKANQGEFFVGLYMEDFSHIEDVANFATGTAKGMNDIAVGIAYNKKYVVFEPDIGFDLSSAQDGSEWYYDGGQVVDAWKDRANYTGSITKVSTVGSYSYADGVAGAGEATDSGDTANSFDMAFGMSVKHSMAANALRVRYSGDYTGYLVIMKFKFTADAATASTGTQVIGFSKDSQQTSMSFGTSDNNGNDKVVYQLSGSKATTGGTQDIEEVVEFDASEIKALYPRTFNLKYYNKDSSDFSAETAFKTESVLENATPAPSQIPASSDFSNPGNFLTGMKYTTSTAANTTNDSTFDPSNPPKILADTYVYGVWEAGRTVTFDSNYAGGGVVASPMPTETTKPITVNPASTTYFAASDEPTVGTNGTEDFAVPDHYEFDGWYDAATGGNQIVFDGATTLVSSLATAYKAYAHWNHKVTVEYYPSKADAAAGTNKIDSEEVDNNTAYASLTKIPADPTSLDDDTNHKYYNGWKNANGDTAVDFTASGNVGTDDVFKVYQDWVDYYKVEFYDDEASGNPALIDTEYVNQRTDTTLAASDIPTGPTAKAPSGKGFGGWVYDVSGTNTTFDENVDVTTAQTNGVLKVYPEWATQFDVKLYPNDGSTSDGLGTPVTHTLLPGASIGSAYSAPTRTHYVLKEWNTKANGSGTSYALSGTTNITNATFTGNTDLYAIWEINPSVPATDRATLTFDTVGGSTISPIVVYKGDKIYQAQMPNNPTKTGPTATDVYTFVDWFEAATLSNTNIVTRPITMNDDKTIYAHWTYTDANKVTITFNDNGADVKQVSPTSVAVAPGDSLGAAWPTNPEKTDKSFGGWFDNTTEYTSSSAINSDVTVVAKWNDRVKVVYNTNGGNADGPADVEQPATTNYADVTTVPTRSNYRFVGWYTKTNGSGHEIKAGTNPYDTSATPATLTYGDLITIPGATVSGTTVTLYARWAAVDSGDESGVPGGTVDPADNAVKVTFDDNVPSASTHTIIKSADPKYMYPNLGEALSAVGGLPEDPTRNDYVFQSWNTRADGTGTTFTASEVINANTDSITVNGNKYALTLYAQWEVDPNYSNKVTLTFNKNINGKGESADKYVEYKLAANDILNFVPTKPSDSAKDNFKFEGWFVSSGADANGKQQLSNTTTSPDMFTATTPIAADVTYYAKWRMQLVAVVQPTTISGNPVYGDIYSGTAKHPVYKFYRVPVDKMGTTITEADYIPYVFEDGSGSGLDVLNDTTYKAEYTPQAGGTAATTMTDVGKYNINVSLLDSSALAISGVEIGKVAPAVYEILPAQWTVKVDPDTQEEPKTSSIAGPTIEVYDTDGTTLVASTRYSISYRKITGDVNNDNNIDPADDLGSAQTTVPTDIAKYVVIVKPTGTDATNYTIGKVDTTKTGTPVKVYPTTAAQSTDPIPSYTTAGIGENIYYEIKANDPSANTMTADLTVQPVGSPAPAPVTTAVPFKDNTYASQRNFDNAETPAYKDYYMIVPKTATEVKLTITPKYSTTTVGVTYGNDATAAQATGATAAAIATGTPVTVGGETVTPNIATVPVDTTKAQTVAAVKMAATGGTPSITYLVTIKTSEAEIKLNYGNSPYALIEKMATASQPWTSSKITSVRTAFDSANRFTAADLPDGAEASLPAYTLEAWGGSTDSKVNMDRNLYAIFTYNKKDFRDTGFTVTDGNGGSSVADTAVTRTITVQRMANDSISDMLSNSYTPDTVTITNVANNAVYTTIADTSKNSIVPDVYYMTYSFVDPYTNETIEIKRPIVMLWQLGDVDMTDLVNPSDVTGLYSLIKNKYNFSAVDPRIEQLYRYRIADADTSAIINPSDVTGLYSIIKNKAPKYIYQLLP